MFCIRKPTETAMRGYLQERQDLPFSYEPANGTQLHNMKEEFEEDPVFQGFDIAQRRVKLGMGENCYRKAVQGMREWKTFDVGWAQLCFDDTPIQVGSTVAILSYQMGMWVASFCRITSVVEEMDEGGDITRFGFSYGTLNEHVVKGEERFLIEWTHSTDEVWYDLLSFSSPRHWMTQIAYPVAKYFQDKFATASCEAMQRVVGSITQI